MRPRKFYGSLSVFEASEFTYSEVIQLAEDSESIQNWIESAQLAYFGHCHDRSSAARKLNDSHAVDLYLR
jgi:hypothetical protein